MGLARQADGLGDAAQVVVHDDHVGGFHGDVGAHRAHGESDVGLRQGRRIVDAVAGHAGGAKALLQRSDLGQLVFGQQVAMRFVDAGLRGDRPGSRHVVASEHDRRDAQRLEFGYGLARRFLDGVGDREDGDDAAFIGQQGYRSPLRFVRVEHRFDVGAALIALLHQPLVAKHVGAAVDAAPRAATRQCSEIVDLARPIDRADRAVFLLQSLRNGFRYGVIGAFGQVQGDASDTPDKCLVGAGWQRGPRHQFRLAFGEGAGLVERDGLQVARFFQVRSALDQDAAPRCRCQRADDRHRR